jgi:hypothetical protein
LEGIALALSGFVRLDQDEPFLSPRLGEAAVERDELQ